MACPAADAGRNWRGLEARVDGLRGTLLHRGNSLKSNAGLLGLDMYEMRETLEAIGHSERTIRG